MLAQPTESIRAWGNPVAEVNNSVTWLDSPRGWVVVLGAFFVAFVAFGVTYTFGVFLKPIGVTFNANHATMTTLFSTLSVLSFFLAPLTGEIADRIGPHYVVGAGALLMGSGLLLTARVHAFPLLFLTYGGLIGAAVACLYVPSIAAVGEWFKKYRDIALGISISGIGCGTLVAAPLAAHLTAHYGWRNAFETFAWASTAILLVCAVLVSRPPGLKEKQKIDVWPKVRTQTFWLLYAAVALCGIAIFVAFVFVTPFAMDVGATHVAAAALVGYIGASSVVGRLGLNALAERFGLLNMYKASYWILLLGCAIWLVSHNYPMLVVFALVLGVGYGGIAAMTPAVAAARFGIEGLGEVLGLLLTSFGVASLVGPPAAGIMADRTHDYRWPVFIAVATALAALMVVVLVRDSQETAEPAPETTVAERKS
jgi:MFS family permease